ncbi:MAG: hypothetical protein ACK5L5_03810 [Bacteroidales bacterium]
MRRNLLVIACIAAIALYSCENKSGSQKEDSKQETSQQSTSVQTFKVDDLMEEAPMFIDKEIKLVGDVTHTCKHSGKRCFLEGEKESYTVRVEAGGDIGGFNRELVGNTICVDGVLKERRLTKEYIDQWEEKVKEKEQKEDGSAESCQAEMSNIDKMRQWMADNDKEYYSIFYVDGKSYDIVD